MKEKDLIKKLRKACNDIVPNLHNAYNDDTFETLSFAYFDDPMSTPYFEFYGSKEVDFDPYLIMCVKHVMFSVCANNGIVFIFSPNDEDKPLFLNLL